jgi:hypothetical protein
MLPTNFLPELDGPPLDELDALLLEELDVELPLEVTIALDTLFALEAPTELADERVSELRPELDGDVTAEWDDEEPFAPAPLGPPSLAPQAAISSDDSNGGRTTCAFIVIACFPRSDDAGATRRVAPVVGVSGP